MRKSLSRAIATIASIVIGLSPLSQPITGVAAENTVTIAVTGTYDQTNARRMLNMINDFRTGSDAWYWNESNTEKVQCQGLSEYTYDYELEQIAMQRAMEIAVYYSHERPNGTVCKTAFTYLGNGVWWGENIAMGTAYDTAEEVFEGWQETNRNYDGQGHRRNMLETHFVCVGISHVVRDGVNYWVQDFRGVNIQPTETTAINSAKSVDVECLTSKLKAEVNTSQISMNYGGSYDLSNVRESVYYEDEFKAFLLDENSSLYTKPISSFTVSDSSVIKVDGSSLKGLRAGTANLKGNLSTGTAFSIPVTVKGISLSGSSFSSIDTQEYTGSAITPSFTVTCNGKTLVKDTDYTATYSNNVNEGWARITITGKGNYTGTATTNFYIHRTQHQNNGNGDSSNGSEHHNNGNGNSSNGSGNHNNGNGNGSNSGQSNGNTNNSNSGQNNDGQTDTNNDSSDVETASTSKTFSFSLSKGKKCLTVDWYMPIDVDGYEIQYSTSKKMTNAKIKKVKGSKTSVKIKKLKSKKKYYVRMRCHKKILGEKVYSGWSKIKKVKVK